MYDSSKKLVSAPPPCGSVLLPLSKSDPPLALPISDPEKVNRRRSRVPLPDPVCPEGISRISLPVIVAAWAAGAASIPSSSTANSNLIFRSIRLRREVSLDVWKHLWRSRNL